MSEAGNLSEYTPSVDEMVRALSYWGHMTREEARAAVNRRIDFIEAAAVREAMTALFREPVVAGVGDPVSEFRRLSDRADRIESQETP